MTEEAPVENPEEAPAEEEVQEEESVSGNCRWCGEPKEGAEGDWLCDSCERYQDAMTCPTCSGLARVSMLPAELVPAPVKPKKRKG
jgi:hypothetical protein